MRPGKNLAGETVQESKSWEAKFEDHFPPGGVVGQPGGTADASLATEGVVGVLGLNGTVLRSAQRFVLLAFKQVSNGHGAAFLPRQRHLLPGKRLRREMLRPAAPDPPGRRVLGAESSRAPACQTPWNSMQRPLLTVYSRSGHQPLVHFYLLCL